MTKDLFLKQLEQNLRPLGAAETADILRDQNEFITDAVSSGRREADVIAALGEPKKFASSIIAESRLVRAEAATSDKLKLNAQVSATLAAVVAFLALAPLNIFVLFVPFAILLFLLFAGWCVTFSFGVVSLAMVYTFFSQLMMLPVTVNAHIAFVAFALGMAAVCDLSGIIMYHLSRWFLKGTVGYIRWNYNFMKEKFN